jgi:hypothetical protein
MLKNTAPFLHKIIPGQTFSIDMDALTGKAGDDPIVSFFLLIWMP